MSELSPDDLERLASRLAMLASESGEADNAGRAVGQLARRLGLSGGDLKAMFLAGAGAGAAAAPSAASAAEPGDGLQAARELATLRRQVKLLEGSARRAQEERDLLAAENNAMRVAQYRRRATRRIVAIAAAAGLAMVAVVVAAMSLWGPDLGPGPRLRADAARAPAAAPNSSGVVRGPRAPLYRDPDRNGPLVAVLPQGTRVAVRRITWNMMTQWAEVETAGQLGYIPTTEIEIY